MLMSIAFLLALLGLLLLALAMDKHHRQVFGKTPFLKTKAVFRVTGAASLSISLVLCAQIIGWSVGAVLWFGLLNLAAIIVALFFTYGLVRFR